MKTARSHLVMTPDGQQSEQTSRQRAVNSHMGPDDALPVFDGAAGSNGLRHCCLLFRRTLLLVSPGRILRDHGSGNRPEPWPFLLSNRVARECAARSRPCVFPLLPVSRSRQRSTFPKERSTWITRGTEQARTITVARAMCFSTSLGSSKNASLSSRHPPER